MEVRDIVAKRKGEVSHYIADPRLVSYMVIIMLIYGDCIGS